MISDHSLSAEGGDDEGHGGGAEEGEVGVDHGAVEAVVVRQHGVEAEIGWELRIQRCVRTFLQSLRITLKMFRCPTQNCTMAQH